METLAQAMARVKASTDLKAFCDAHLDARPKDGPAHYACPSPTCRSGKSGRAGSDTAFHLYRGAAGESRYKCQSCGIEGDVFDLAGILYATADRAEQCNAVAEWARVAGWEGANKATETKNRPTSQKPVERPANAPREADTGAPERVDVGESHEKFYAEAHAALMASPEALAYLHGRGITDETAERFNLGYVASWTHPKTRKYPTKRLIMPRTARTYTARAIDPTERYYNAKFKKQVVGTQKDLFNLEAARGAEVVVVVEGELDAMSIEQATEYAAVGIGSIGNVGSFVERAAKVAPYARWLVALDNDAPKEDGSNPGQAAQAELVEGMAKKGLTCAAVDGATMYGDAKDANEALTKNPETLKAALDEAAERSWRDLMGDSRVVSPSVAVRELYDLKDGRPPVPTGLDMLDNLTGGGLHAKSLHVIGAQSSEGKTTLTLQVADAVARGGHPVLFVTIEQRAQELIAKSLARMSYEATGSASLKARAIMNPTERKLWQPEAWASLTDASNAYAESVAPHMLFMDPDEPPTVGEVWSFAAAMGRRYGEPPVVFIDYLQLLAAPAGHERDGDKQVTDKNVTLLRRMAGALNTPVWVVASVNRQSYTAPIGTDSFKESGAIEYGADVLMGLEPFDLETRWHNAGEKKRAAVAKGMHDATRQAETRWMDLRVLKNRFGALPADGLPFAYQASADSFRTLWKVRREKRDDDEAMPMAPPEIPGGESLEM